ncbi:hypothetical protein SARC_15994, partial [Sphaeroforma arctica JP610]
PRRASKPHGNRPTNNWCLSSRMRMRPMRGLTRTYSSQSTMRWSSHCALSWMNITPTAPSCTTNTSTLR